MTERTATQDPSSPTPGSGDGDAPLAVVVAMKPQLRGRVRRNVQTLLDLGYRVVVIAQRTNKEFFVGLESPRLTARFVPITTPYGHFLAWQRRGRIRREYVAGLKRDAARRRYLRRAWHLRGRPRALVQHLVPQPRFRAPYGRAVTVLPRPVWGVAVVAAVPAGIVALPVYVAARALAVVGVGVRRVAGTPPARPDAGTGLAQAGGPDEPVQDWWGESRRAAHGALRGIAAGAWRAVRPALRAVDRHVRVPAVAARDRLRERVEDSVAKVLIDVNRIAVFASFWRESQTVVRELEPDVVVSSDLPGLVGAARAARALGIGQVHDCHELYLESTGVSWYEKAVLRPIERRHMRRTTRVVAVNASIAEEYARRYGVDPGVVRNCTDPPGAMEPRDIRDLAGIEPGTTTVLYQGGFGLGRGLDVCVAAMVDVDPSAHLVLLGYGPLADELGELARQHGVEDRVHVLPAVPPDQLLACTASATVGLIPYQPVSRNNYYTLPNKIFEYTSVGVPVVTSDLPELRRIAVDAGCGVVYDPYSATSLAEAINAAVDPQRHHRLRSAAARYGAENTWTQEREVLVAAIHEAQAVRGVHVP